MSWTAFHLLAAAMLTVLVLLVTLPLLSRQRSARATSNVALTKQRLAELDREADAGLISAAELRQAKDELKLALVDEQDTPSGQAARPRITALVIIAGAVLVMAAGGYVYRQVSQLPELHAQQAAIDALPALSAKLSQGEQQTFSETDVKTLISAIRARVHQQPDDAQGWMYLGRLQMSLGLQDDAQAALARAYTLEPSPATTTSYVQALLASEQRRALQQATQVLTQQLTRSADNIQYQLMLAVAYAQLGQARAAQAALAQVGDALPASNPLRQDLEARIAQLQPATSNKAIDAATNTSIAVTITLDAAVAKPAWLQQGQLIVFAKAAGTANQMPAAVVKVPVNQFPMQVTLSDDDAMLPGQGLSTLSSVILTARLSADHDVAAAPGELEGSVELALSPGSSVTQAIQINKEL